MAMSLEDRKDELEAMPDAALLRLLKAQNPMGGYSIGTRKGQLTREIAIKTVLRYEGYQAG